MKDIPLRGLSNLTESSILTQPQKSNLPAQTYGRKKAVKSHLISAITSCPAVGARADVGITSVGTETAILTNLEQKNKVTHHHMGE